MSGVDLHTTQRLFWNLITAPEGVVSGARDLEASGDIESADLSFFIEASRTLSPTQRLDIYANMYFYRLRDILADDFPAVAGILGGAVFHNLITDFLLVHPPSRPSLRWLGEPLPGFIAGHEVSETHPWLVDLARLEWARHDVFDDADATPLTREKLTTLPAGQAENTALALVPAVRLLELDWSVAATWRRLDDELAGEEAGGRHSAAIETGDGFSEPVRLESPPEQRRSFMRAWRQDMKVYHRSMKEDEAACLAAVGRDGASLQQLAEVLMGLMGRATGDGESVDEQRATEVMTRLAALTDLWLNDGILRLAPAGETTAA